MDNSYLSTVLTTPEDRQKFLQESLLFNVASLIDRTMQKKGLTRKELADKLGLTKGRISQYLGGERNLRLRTLADIFSALGCKVEIAAKDMIEHGEWQSDVVKEKVVLAAKWSFVDKCVAPADAQQSLAG